ncbi:MAG: hypothetical protein AAB853_02280 [Patescibacteria group bacterium]
MQTHLLFLRFQVFLLKYHLQLLVGTFLVLLTILLSMIANTVNLLGQAISEQPECSDSVNSDPENDDTFDYPGDVGCVSGTDPREWKDGECFDGFDNDRDGFIDRRDFGCRTPYDGEARPKARCEDTVDNDGDRNIDMQDSGCTSTQDPSEN